MAIVSGGSNGLMRVGMGIGLALLVIWVVAFVVMKVTSLAIHLLLLAAVVFLGMHAYAWLKDRGHQS